MPTIFIVATDDSGYGRQRPLPLQTPTGMLVPGYSRSLTYDSIGAHCSSLFQVFLRAALS